MMPRIPRDNESREKSARTTYVPPSHLPEPEPNPDWVFRWIATAVMGQNDPTNVSRKFREGWVPVSIEDQPSMALFKTDSGNIETGGLMLCKMPRELAEARERYYAEQTRAQMESVDSTFMRENDARMPLFSDKKSEVTRGRGGFGSGTK